MHKDSYNKRTIGSHYEKIAGAYLEQQGMEIITYNWNCRSGEIDIIAQDEDYLVFCEVKYRKTVNCGYPIEAVDGKKQQNLWKCANIYLTKQGIENIPCRFDVIGVLGQEPYEITYIKDAFGQ